MLARPSISYRSQFVVPIEFGASVLKAHVYRQVVGMTVGSLYRANAYFSGPLGSIQYSHQRADACLMRFQEAVPRIARPLGPGPNSSPK
jgi:hypothetical protein